MDIIVLIKNVNKFENKMTLEIIDKITKFIN